MFDYKDKVALVTGGANGIGLELAKELLRRGARVVALVDIDDKNGLIAANDIKVEFKRNDCVIFIKTDVSNKEQFKNAFDIVVNTYKQLDILINTAGILDERNWEKSIAINLTAVVTGTILATETYFPKYRKGSESLAINIGSITVFFPTPTIPVYVAVKSGVVLFTKTMGHESRYKDTKTRIIAFCPSRVDSNLLSITENEIAEPYLSRVLNAVQQQPLIKSRDFVKTLLDTAVTAPPGSVWSVTEAECKKVE